MARQTSINFTGGLQYTYATAPTDLFKKEDVQLLAVAQDQHDHSAGKGLPINGNSLVDGSVAVGKLAPGAVANQAVGGDLRGTVADARIFIDQSRGLYEVSSTGDHPVITFGGENLFWASAGAGYRWVNQANTVQYMTLDTSGNLGVSGSVGAAGNVTAAAAIVSGGRITSGADLVVNSGTLYLGVQGDTVLTRVNADNVRLPTTVWIGGAQDTWLQRQGVGILATNNMFTCPTINVVEVMSTTVYFHPNKTVYLQLQGSVLVATGFSGITFNPPLTVNSNGAFAGSCQAASFTASGNVYYFAGNAANITWNSVYLNHSHSIQFNTTGNQIVWPNASFISGNAGYVQGSQRALKQNVLVVTDDVLMGKVADPRMEVSSYSWPEDPDQRENIGFMADDVAAVLPNYVIKDDSGTPIGYTPQELTAILWGAVRSLNGRVTTLEGAA